MWIYLSGGAIHPGEYPYPERGSPLRAISVQNPYLCGMSYTDRQTPLWEEEGEERPRRHRDPDPEEYDPEEEYYRELEGDPEED